MHKRGVVLSVLRNSQRRSVATATKTKPALETWDAPTEPIRPPPPNFNKWARPPPPRPPPSPPPRSVPRDARGSNPSSSFNQKFSRDLAPHNGLNPRNDRGTLRHALDRVSRASKNEPKSTTSGNNNDSKRLSGRAYPTNGPFEGGVSRDAHGSRTNRNARKDFKDRGSLVHGGRDGAAIPSHPRVQSDKAKAVAKKKVKMVHARKVAVDVFIPSIVSVGQLARLLNIRLATLVRKMVAAGMEAEASHDHVLTSDYAALLAGEFGRNPIINDEAAFDIYPRPPHPDSSTLPTRPPIITIMGHVDHGKTTLLDTLRSASVAKGEAGGITQHIGAFSVPVTSSSDDKNGSRVITFLDTPGHAAFSAMRARGAGVTDIIVLVVAADDGVMPQTKEVIDLIEKDKSNVSVVVAINKVDKPEADVQKVQHALLAEGVQLEVFGGDVPCVEVSGLTGQGLDDLIEVLSAMAEVQDLRAERDGQGYGCVLESRVQKGLGPVTTVLVLRGCITPGSHLIAGTSAAKVRLMTDSSGSTVKAAYPGMAVTVSGWKDLPHAGDEVLQGGEAEVKKALTNRLRKLEIESSLADLEAINAHRMQERMRKSDDDEDSSTNLSVLQEETIAKELRLVVKGDVSGSVEALVGALEGIGNKDARVKIVATGVGDVMESDVMMAKASEGTIIAFSVSTPRSVENTAAQNHVPLYSSKIIYRVMDEVRSRVAALLPCTIEKKVTGEATVLQLFEIHLKAKQTKKIAGCRVGNGVISLSKPIRVIRNGEIIHEGPVEALRQLKKEVTEVKKGSECGMSLENFQDLREGDLIQNYEELKIPGILS